MTGITAAGTAPDFHRVPLRRSGTFATQLPGFADKITK